MCPICRESMFMVVKETIALIVVAVLLVHCPLLLASRYIQHNGSVKPREADKS